jgi:hypothetical protein
MDQPGPFQLTSDGNAFSVVGAGVQTGDIISGFAGIQGLTLQAQFLYGSGGTSAIVYVQTSIDQGQTWIDIWAEEFTTSSATEVVNLSGFTARTTPLAPTNQALTPGTCNDGILGDRFRAVVVSSGTYGGTTLLNITGMAR